ncbi:small subunit processome component 20 homolog [Leptopilina heterotoma]|uniref:small subunit processome component 20 homolog n=1 Tax=Leptopilina heterotoma TaxID=63436 RepID=UPI001CA944CE|nr:small subunit processome component 20 homolog [Leptopilina heterotoma]
MKTKPLRHKETNTFKFKPFSERVTQIDVDVFHRVSHRYEDDTEEETHFYQALQKWNVLNLSEIYGSLKKEFRNIITLPQLLNSQQHVLDTLLKYLKLKDPLCLQTVLELIVAVSRDLQKEFCQHFPEFLTAIIDLLWTKDADQLEYTFTTLAYLFKFLWRYLIRNVDKIFNLLLPLLSESRPHYINNFAAESFSFVVRKVKDKENFLKLVLNALEETPNGVSGCGKLLFEVISSISGQFHSCAEELLTLYFESLENEELNQQLLYKVLIEIINNMQAINYKKSDVLWTVILRIMDKFIEQHSTYKKSSEREDPLILILRLMFQLIHQRGGRIVKDPLNLARKLADVITTFEKNPLILEEILKNSTDLLLAPCVTISQETGSYLTLKILSIQYTELLLNTIEQLISFSSFESLILPRLMKMNIEMEFKPKYLRLLSKIIKIKAPPSLRGNNLQNWRKFPLNIQEKTLEIDYLRKKLQNFTQEPTNEAIHILLILPHLCPLHKDLDSALCEIILNLYKKLDDETNLNLELIQKFSFLFLLALDSMIHIKNPDLTLKFLSKTNLVKLTQMYKNQPSILNSLDLVLTHVNESQSRGELINETTFESLHQFLAENLRSENPRIRLTVAHIFYLFNQNGNKNVFELIYLAENEPATVHKYREKLLHLQAINFDGQALNSLDPSYYDIPLNYLIGNFYLNFSLIWEPCGKILATYANKQCPQFWPIFLSQLKMENNIPPFYKTTINCDVITSLENEICVSEEKIDFDNYRLQLWKSMENFTDYCETKNRDLTVMFIDFVDRFVFKSNSEDGKSCNIEKRGEIDGDAKEEEEEDEDEDTKEEEDKENEDQEKEEEKDGEKEEEKVDKEDKNTKEENKETQPNTKIKIKLLLAQMQIFSKVVNPKSLYRETEMSKIYLDLLSSKNAEIQKAALNCLFAYKHKYLIPYKEHLSNFVDEKQLKNQLTHFKITNDESMIDNAHRDDLFPILMRIIYAKMTTRVGMRTGGKSGGLHRRKMILRFLAGAEEKEMFTFVQMAFKPFLNQLLPIVEQTNNLNNFIQQIIENVDLKNVTPPKRLQSAVNLLAILIEQFGGKMMDKLLPHLLRILLTILAQITGIVQKLTTVHSGFLSSIKNIRTTSLNILARFFIHFENYNWTSDEIDALFTVGVFPWLEKLPIEGIHSPTPLLKIFLAWSQNSRYFALLVKHQEKDSTFMPLVFIVRLLLHPKAHSSVTNTILEILEKLLTLENHEKNPHSMEIDNPVESLNSIASNILQIDDDTLPKGINYGSSILLPHVPDILEFMRRKLERSKKFNKSVKKTDLTILSRISEFITNSETSGTLLELLVPILVKKSNLGESEDILIDLLTTITNLCQKVENPGAHVRIIIPLIGSISSVPARKDLTKLFNIIAHRSSSREMISEFNLLAQLNAYDSKWLDQPDFEKRLDTFAKIKNLLEENSLSLEFGVAVIYNCFFFLKNDNDLAVRYSSTETMKLISKHLAKSHKENPINRRYLIEDTILGIIRKNLRSKNEKLRLELISFLGFMALECSDVHPVLRDLSLLANKLDPEVDFFENLQHLQLHRKVRALLKFSTVAKTLNKAPNPKTLTQFILPLASSYLLNEDFLNKNSIVDAAIEVVGSVCRLLPWHHYEIVLKFYLDKMRHSHDFHKQLIKIIVVILDAFHYDLSKYKEVTIEEKLKQIQEDEKEKKTSALEKLQGENSEEILEELKEKDEKEEEEENLEDALEKLEAEDERENEGENETENERGTKKGIKRKIERGIERETEAETNQVPLFEKQTILSSYVSKRLIFSISRIFLPQLNRAIVARTQHENSHKVNRKRTSFDREEEELMRVPVALAFVKLLQKLPESMLDSNLPGIFMKICTFLKSRLESVRRTTREVLQKIMITLGPAYLHYLLREMNTLLTKGFQIHVLVFTIQTVLVSLKPHLEPTHVNKTLTSILSVCKIDLFGLTAEEKEVAGIIKNVSEAKSTKSYDIFHILAEFINETCLIDIIMPLKEVLLNSHSSKKLHKVGECLRQICLGLADNRFIEVHSMTIFLYGIVSESIPDLLPKKLKETTATEKEIKARAFKRPDIFLIAPVPKRRTCERTMAKTTENANAHFLIEFGLRLLHIFLKRDKFLGSDFKPLLNPFVGILNDSLKSQHVKICTLSLQCLNWILKMDLPAVHELISEICASIFKILHKYAVADLSKGDNYDLVMSAFKCASVIVRDVKHFTINEEQLKLLILYVEQDLHDSEKQATAYGLLRAIISRKMIVPEMHEVMKKVSTLIVTSELDHVKQQSRQIFYSYLVDYPLGKKIQEHLEFFVAQLSFELQPGRMSVLEMLHNIVKGFPLKVLMKQAVYLFVAIGIRIINDDDPECQKLCAKCIQDMLERLSNNKRNELFDIVTLSLKDKKMMHRSLAVQLCGLFVLVEKEKFERRLNDLLPLILKQFYSNDIDETKPGRFVKIQKNENEDNEENEKDQEKLRDHHLIRLFHLLVKLSTNCTAFLKDKKLNDHIHSFAEQSQSLLAHPHLWVRLGACQFLEFILATIDTKRVEKLLKNPDDNESGYIYSDPVNTLKSLTLDLIAQLHPEMNVEELSNQVVKNLVFIARLLKSLNPRYEKSEDNEEADKSNSLSLLWLVKRMRRSVNMEVTQSPKLICVRNAVFKWIAGIVSTIPMDILRPLLFNLLSPLVREMATTEESNAPLRQLAKEISVMIKKRLDSEEYIQLLSKVQQKIDSRKTERKKIRKQQVITDPELAAKRKISKQQKKKVARKRKIECLKGKKVSRKKPRREVDLEMG